MWASLLIPRYHMPHQMEEEINLEPNFVLALDVPVLKILILIPSILALQSKLVILLWNKNSTPPRFFGNLITFSCQLPIIKHSAKLCIKIQTQLNACNY